jgi:D-alanine-D-alanine ligase
MKYRKTAVLMGGLSREREVSLKSGNAVAEGLKEAGYQTVKIDVTHNLDLQLRDIRIDAAFIALHGKYGEDGTVQGMLEFMKIPYTGSSLLASAIAMDKAKTREIATMAGIKTAPGYLIKNGNDITTTAEFPFPVVVKPATEGSSVGVSIVKDAVGFNTAVRESLSCSPAVLVEQFIAGTEVNVAILDGELLGSVEIESLREFYDYKAKYEPGSSIHHIPPRLPGRAVKGCEAAALKTYDAIGCSGPARVDFIITKDEIPVMLEINTSPGMTATSLFPEIAAKAGISFAQLTHRIISGARCHIS